MSLDLLKLNMSNKSIDDIDTLLAILNNIRNEKIQSKYELARFCNEYSQYISANYSIKYSESVKLSLNHLIDFFDPQKSLDEISIKDAESFLSWLKKRAPRGYQVYYRNLKAAFNKAKDWESIKDNPFSKIKLRREQKEYPFFITKNQLSKILDNCMNDALQEIYFFAFHTGLRLSEIINLRWKSISIKDRIITVGDNEFQTKSKAQRKVPLSNELYNKVWNWYSKGRGSCSFNNGYVFSKPNGFPYNPDYISRSFKKVCRKIGLDERIHFHSLRHSFASTLVQNGVNLYTIKELLGHSSITTTEVYSHLNIGALQKAVEVLNAA